MKKKLVFQLLTISFFALTISNCKKTNDTQTTPPVNPPPTDTTSNPPVPNKLVVIDSTKLTLNTDTALISVGKYEYSYTDSVPDIKPNDVIVGSTNGGYIRKINSVSRQAGKVTLLTSQGSMEDVFKQAKFNFDINSDNLMGLKTAGNFTHNLKGKHLSTQKFTSDLNNISIYKDGPLNIILKSGNVELDGDWNFDFNFNQSILDTFEMSCKNAVFNAEVIFNVKASQAVALAKTESIIKTVSKYFTEIIPIAEIPVPVVIEMKIDLVCQFSASINAATETDVTGNTYNKLNVGLEYKNGQWQTIYDKTSASTITVNEPDGKISSAITLGLVPKVSFIFYGVAGPYASFGLQELLKGNVASPALDWDFYAGAWLQTIIGAKGQILGTTLGDYRQEWNTDTLNYQTPYEVQKLSGDNQTASPGKYLSEPVKVKVTDNNKIAQSNVPVYFKVTAGSGRVDDASGVTDTDGYAETKWKLGDENIIQTISATVKKADGTLITGSPTEFAATIKQQPPSLTTTDVKTITKNSAVAGGNITSNGGSSITARGVCWNTTSNPTIANSKTSDGSGTGSFTSNISGLTANTTYHVRAYAVNSSDTAYGQDESFKTFSLPEITTTSVTSITGSSAVAGGNITSNGGSSITARGVCWNTTSNPTVSNDNTIDGGGTGSFTSNIIGLTANTTYHVRAYAINSSDTAYGQNENFTTSNETVSTFTDARDGQVYQYKKIGSQVWMTQDLNYITDSSWCYDNNSTNCSVYGRLYTWNKAMIAAPPGWHLPSETEWHILINYLGDSTVAGGKMKEKGLLHWVSPNGGANNSSGFTALPGGERRASNGAFDLIGADCKYWTSNEYLWWNNDGSPPAGYPEKAWNCGLNFYTPECGLGFLDGYKLNGFSVRCIKN